MKHLNEQATKVFCRILRKLNNKEHIKITSEGFMPLSVEKLDDNLQTETGTATLYSLCHYYEQNSDLMRDPEMCFIVLDARTHPKDYAAIKIFPQMYQVDSLGLYEESIEIKDGRVISVIDVWQKGHCGFANLWLKNIRQQGFLK